jgi:S1-C subfamily serine protease
MSYVDRPSPPPRFSLGLPLLLFLVLLGVLWWRFGPNFWKEGPLHNPAAQLRPAAPPGDRLADEQNTIQIFKDDFPGVALITPLAMRTNLYTGAVQETPRGTGSGFVWDSEGNIVTNFHVIQSAEGAQVLLPTFKEPFKARLVGVDPDNDLAVLKIDAPADRLKPLPIARNEELEVGQKALAIGNPFGLSGTLTVATSAPSTA